MCIKKEKTCVCVKERLENLEEEVEKITTAEPGGGMTLLFIPANTRTYEGTETSRRSFQSTFRRAVGNTLDPLAAAGVFLSKIFSLFLLFCFYIFAFCLSNILHRREICVSFPSSKWQQFCFSLVLQFCTFLCRSSTLIFRGFVESQYTQ